MATYVELFGLMNDPTLTQKVQVACIISADTIRQESGGTANHANRLKWAKKVWMDPVTMANDMLKALLAANNTLTVAQLNSASDASILTAVNNAVDVFADGT